MSATRRDRGGGAGLWLAAHLGVGGTVGGPLLGVLRDAPEFLVAHGVTSPALLAVGILLAPGLLAALGCALLGPFRRTARAVALGSLTALALLAPLVRALSPAPWLALVLAVFGGAGFGLAAQRRPTARRFAAALLLAPLFAFLHFVAHEPIRRLGASAAQRPAASSVAADFPVVWVVFDELPLSSLLDAAGGVDAEHFPAFASLAAGATWYRNATGAAGVTALAFPALLTGRHPSPERLPTAADHPANAFSLLGGHYRLHVEEPRTLLWEGAPAERGEVGALAADLLVLWAHSAWPEPLTRRLPPVRDDWRGFGALRDRKLAGRGENRIARFVDFVADIERCSGRCLHFVHSVLPHVPWHFMPGGRPVPTWNLVPGLRREDKRWGPEDRWAAEGYQRHLFQVKLVDRMLGRLLARLHQLDLYERALLIVTADHGASFWPAVRSRALFADHPHLEDLVRVPLFLKRPGQKAPAVDDRPVAAVDLLPTLVDLLGVRGAAPMDGRSVVAPGERPPRIGVTTRGERLALPAAFPPRSATLERKLALFARRDGRLGLFGTGPHRDLVGRRASDFPQLSPAAEPAVLAQSAFEEPTRLPVRLLGSLSGELPGRTSLAAAVDGRIAAVAPLVPHPDGGFAWSLFLPEALADAPLATLELLLVSGPGDAPRLQPLPFEPGPALDRLQGRSWQPAEPLPSEGAF